VAAHERGVISKPTKAVLAAAKVRPGSGITDMRKHWPALAQDCGTDLLLPGSSGSWPNGEARGDLLRNITDTTGVEKAYELRYRKPMPKKSA
jgi:hypothetical protein